MLTIGKDDDDDDDDGEMNNCKNSKKLLRGLSPIFIKSKVIWIIIVDINNAV